MTHKTKGLRIATRCTTLDQFVAAFHRFCDAQTFFISTLSQRAVGLETAFSIDLVDHTPALRGIGVVLEAWSTADNPFGRPGLQLGIRRLTADSEPVFERLLRAQEAKLPRAPTSSTSPVVVRATTPRPDTITSVETRTPGSDLVLPANPLMNLTDESLEGFVDCTLYEQTANFFPAEPTAEDPSDSVVEPPLFAPLRPVAPVAVTFAPAPEVIAEPLPTLPEPATTPFGQPVATTPFAQPVATTPPSAAAPTIHTTVAPPIAAPPPIPRTLMPPPLPMERPVMRTITEPAEPFERSSPSRRRSARASGRCPSGDRGPRAPASSWRAGGAGGSRAVRRW